MIQMEVLLEKCLVKDYGKQIAVVLFFCKKFEQRKDDFYKHDRKCNTREEIVISR